MTVLYDSFMQVLMKETLLKTRLVCLMDAHAGESVLDFGCGTGTLCLMIQKAVPGCTVTGLDIDPAVLGIARKKALAGNAGITFVQYDGILLPFPDNSFDKIASTFVVHHLPEKDKSRLFREIFRVLKPGGRILVLDFGIPRTRYARIVSRVLAHLEPIGDNLRGGVPVHLERAGFAGEGELFREEILFGTVYAWKAGKPAPGNRE